ncbi:MAG: transposase [Pigmentiphaga sp.]
MEEFYGWKKSRFTYGQVMDALKHAEASLAATELCRKLGISSTTRYKWRAKGDGMDVSMPSQCVIRALKQTIGWRSKPPRQGAIKAQNT